MYVYICIHIYICSYLRREDDISSISLASETVMLSIYRMYTYDTILELSIYTCKQMYTCIHVHIGAKRCISSRFAGSHAAVLSMCAFMHMYMCMCICCTLMYFECHSVPISSLNLAGLCSTKLGKRDLENEINDWDLRMKKWHSKHNRLYFQCTQNSAVLQCPCYIHVYIYLYAYIWICASTAMYILAPKDDISSISLAHETVMLLICRLYTHVYNLQITSITVSTASEIEAMCSLAPVCTYMYMHIQTICMYIWCYQSARNSAMSALYMFIYSCTSIYIYICKYMNIDIYIYIYMCI